MSRPIEIVVTGKDGASGPLRTIEGGLKSLGKTAVAESVHTGGFFKMMAANAAGFVAANAFGAIARQFTGFIGSGIEGMQAAALASAQTNAVLLSTGNAAGVTAKEVTDMATAFSLASGKSPFGDDVIQQAENMTLTFSNISRKVFPDVVKTSLDMAVALKSTPEAMAQMTGKALGSIDGLTALRRVGVQFSDDQVTLAKHLFETGHTVEYQRLVLAELTKEFGGSAAAAAAADGGIGQFKDSMGELAESIVTKAMPLVKQFFGVLNSPGVTAGLQSVADGIITGVGSAVDWIQTTGIPNIKAAWKGIQDVVTGFSTGDFSAVKIDLSSMFGSFDTSIITTALQDIRQGWGLARDALITFQQAWDGDWKNADTILPLHQAIGDFGITARGVFDWLTTTGIPDLSTSFADAMPANKQLIDDVAAAMANLRGTSHETSASVHEDLNSWTSPSVGPALYLNTWAESFARFGAEIHKILVLAGHDWDEFAGQMKSLGTNIGSAFASMGAAAKNFGTTVSEGASFAGEHFGTAWDKIKTAGTAAWSVLYNAAQTANNHVVNAIHGIESSVGTMASTIGTKIADAVHWFVGLPGRISAAVGDLSGTLTAAGSKVVQGLIAGITSKFQAVKTTLSTLTSLLPSWKGPPATDAMLLFGSGKLIIQGLIDGFGAMAPDVRDKLKSITDMIGGAFDAGSKGVDFFGKLVSFKAPDASSIAAFTASTTAIVTALGSVAQGFKAKWLEQAQVFFDAASKGLGVISAGVDGLTKLRTFRAPSIANINAFTDSVIVIVQSLGTAAAIFKDGWLAKASAFEDTAGRGLAIIGNGVDGLTKLKDFKAPSIAAINAFSDTVILMVQSLGTVAQTFKDTWLAHASTFADAAVKGIGIIGGAVEGFTKLSAYTGIAPGALAVFADDLQMVMTVMIAIAKDVGVKGPAAAAAFGDAVGKTIAPIGAAIDAFTKLKEYKGVARDAVLLIGNDMAGVVATLGIIAENTAKAGVDAAVAFATSAGVVFGSIKTAVDALTSLSQYKGIAQSQINLLMHDMTEVSVAIENMATFAAIAAVKVLDWKVSMESIVRNIKAGAATFGSLDGLNVDATVTLGLHERTKVSGLGGKPGTADGGGVQFFAGGVRDFGGGMAVVGENGPELVALPRGSNVYSNSESRGMAAQSATGRAERVVETHNHYHLTLHTSAAVVDVPQEFGIMALMAG